MTTVESFPVSTPHGDSSSKYYLSNDAEERERLHAQHEAVMILMHQQPLHAPIAGHPLKIADIGCGVNADMTKVLAKKFPSATVYGIDLSAVEPTDVPNNVEFVRGNVRNLIDVDPRLTAGTFDYVFSRWLVVGVEDWVSHIQTLTKLVAPGGWLELQDIYALEYKNAQTGETISHGWEWTTHLPSYHQIPEGDTYGMETFRRIFQDCGLQDIDAKPYNLLFDPLPIPEKPEAEAYALYSTTELWKAWAPVFHRKFPSPEDDEKRQRLIENMKECFKPEKDKFIPMTVIWGKKSGNQRP